MRKKALSAILVIALSIITVLGGILTYVFTDYKKWDKIRVADSNLYSDKGYINYAKKVKFDVENYPDMKEMGLFWSVWDEEKQENILIDADSTEGASLINVEKPTLIIVHGMMSDGYYNRDGYYLNSKIAVPEEFGLKTKNVPLGLLWQRAGWNVGYFHYNKFTAEEMNATAIEAKVWAIDGPLGIRYRHSDYTTTDNATQYCIAEHFAAEYIRAMKYLPKNMGDKEIRLAAHSMGGELTTAALFLLTELSSDGQLPKKQLPHRFAMLDPYFSAILLKDDGSILLSMSPKDITINWSKKGLVNNNTGFTMIECLKDISANGIAVEYYAYESSALNLTMHDILKAELKKLSVYVMGLPDYSNYNSKYTILTDGHAGIRDWYMCSIDSEPVKCVDGDKIIGLAASASTPTDVLKQLIGTSFKIYQGQKTVNAEDDLFVIID